MNNALCCIALFIGGLYSVQADQENSSPFSHIDALLHPLAEKTEGCSLLLIDQNQILYQKHYGRFSSRTVLPIASSTKWLSGALIMSLIDQGILSLNDPISKFLPEYYGSKGDITIRQLMSHTSGLNLPSHNLEVFHQTFHRSHSLRESASHLLGLPSITPPGQYFSYGASSMQVAGRICEIASGKNWNQLFQKNIAVPLEMKTIDYRASGPSQNPRIAGGARCSLLDYGKFLRMLLNRGTFNGKRVLSDHAIQAMHTNHTRGIPKRFSFYQNYKHLFPQNFNPGYGIGNWIEASHPQTRQGIIVSSQGAYGCSPWVDYQRNIAGILFVKSDLNTVLPTYIKLRKQVAQLWDKNHRLNDS